MDKKNHHDQPIQQIWQYISGIIKGRSICTAFEIASILKNPIPSKWMQNLLKNYVNELWMYHKQIQYRVECTLWHRCKCAKYHIIVTEYKHLIILYSKYGRLGGLWF